jgi:hypothetical protein
MPLQPTSRPRRATKPTSRRTAVDAPSSTALLRNATASKVSKRAQSTAVTAGLVGRGGSGAGRAARLKSVPQDQVVKKEVAPEPV